MTLSDFLNTYWLQVAGAIIFIGLMIIYWKADDENKRKFKVYLPLLIIVVAWIMLRPFINGYSNWKVVDIIFYTLVFVFFLYLMWRYREKYKTVGQVIADGCHGSFYPNARVIGPFTIFNVGTSCDTLPLIEGDFTLIAPTEFITWEGPKAYIDVQVTKRDLYKMPLPISNFLLSEQNKYNIHDIRFGMFSRALLNSGTKLKNPKGKEMLLKDWEEQFLNSNQNDNLLQEQADGRQETLEKAGQHFKRLKKSLGGGNMFSIKQEKTNNDEVSE